MIGGGLVFAQFEAPVLAQAAGYVAIAHGISDWQAGWQQVFTGKREQSVIEKGVSVTAQALGASQQQGDAIAAADTALGFVNPAGPATGMPRMAVAVASNGQRVVTLTTEASKIPQAISQSSNLTHAMMAANNMASATKGNKSGDGSGGALKPQSSKQEHRVEIQEALQEYLNSGGTIEKISSQPHLHHLLPKELKQYFEKLGIDIEKYKVWLDPKTHLEHVHGGAPEGGLWNQTWKEFFQNNPYATPEQVMDKLNNMRKSFDI